MGLGIGSNNNDMWKLPAANPQVREGAAQKYGVGGQQFGGEGTKGTAGFQAQAGGFDWQILNKFDYSLTGATKPNTEISPTSVNGTNEVTKLFNNQQIASADKFQRPGDNDGSGYKNLELNPNVETDLQRTLGWA